MRPCLSVYDFVYGAMRYPELFADCAMRHFAVKLSNLANLLVGKFAFAVRYSASVAVSNTPLTRAVFHIVQLSTDKKVFRPNTDRIVTAVQHKHASGDWSKVENPRSPRSQYGACARCSEPAIPKCGSRRPYPTWSKVWLVFWNRAVLVNLFPKAFDKLLEHPLCCETVLRKLHLHSVRLVDCLPSLRVFVHRAGNSFTAFKAMTSMANALAP